MQLYRYFVSQSSEVCLHNPLYYFSTSYTKGKRIFRYRLSPETFGYPLVCYQYLQMCFSARLLPIGLFIGVNKSDIYIHFLSPLFISHDRPISFSIVSSRKFCVISTNCEVPRVVFAVFLLRLPVRTFS
jgi:hypothetical protein